MDRPTILILTGGGLRSLVAASTALAVPERTTALMMHVHDDHPAANPRLAMAKRQAGYCGIKQFVTLELPRLKGRRPGNPPGQTVGEPLVRVHVLMLAMVQAIELEIPRIVWPVQSNGDEETIALLTEQVVLAQHLAQTEYDQVPAVDTPLLELTDQQLIELGGQLDLPWKLAWTCLMPGDEHCRACAACRRRHRAFEAAGMVDPLDKHTHVH